MKVKNEVKLETKKVKIETQCSKKRNEFNLNFFRISYNISCFVYRSGARIFGYLLRICVLSWRIHLIDTKLIHTGNSHVYISGQQSAPIPECPFLVVFAKFTIQFTSCIMWGVKFIDIEITYSSNMILRWCQLFFFDTLTNEDWIKCCTGNFIVYLQCSCFGLKNQSTTHEEKDKDIGVRARSAISKIWS